MPQLTTALLNHEAEQYALGQVLTSWDCDATYKNIMELFNHERADDLIDEHNRHMEECEMDDEQYILWEPFENISWNEALDLIEDFKDSIIRRFSKYCIDHEEYNNAQV